MGMVPDGEIQRPQVTKVLKNLDVLLREATGLPVMLAEDPLTAVVLGTGRTLDEMALLREVTIQVTTSI